MARFRDLLGGVIREKTGMQQKVESYNNILSVYTSVISGVNDIEKEAITALKDEAVGTYELVEIKQERLKMQYISGEITDTDYVIAKNLLQEQLDNLVADYVDSMQNHSIRVQRDKLVRTKTNYSHLAGFDMMNFDSFENMKLSSETAQSVKNSLQNGADYESAKKVAESIWRYRRDNHMKRGWLNEWTIFNTCKLKKITIDI